MIALFLFALGCALAQNDPCQDNESSEAVCLKAQDYGCNWCASRAVPSRCLDWDTARHYPPGAFNCGNATRSDCDIVKTNDTCSEMVGCAWCTSFTVAPACRNMLNASHLPASVFDCQYY